MQIDSFPIRIFFTIIPLCCGILKLAEVFMKKLFFTSARYKKTVVKYRQKHPLLTMCFELLIAFIYCAIGITFWCLTSIYW